MQRVFRLKSVDLTSFTIPPAGFCGNKAQLHRWGRRIGVRGWTFATSPGVLEVERNQRSEDFFGTQAEPFRADMRWYRQGPLRLYADRAAGGHRHYRAAHRDPSPRDRHSAQARTSADLPLETQASPVRRSDLSERQQGPDVAAGTGNKKTGIAPV